LDLIVWEYNKPEEFFEKTVPIGMVESILNRLEKK